MFDPNLHPKILPQYLASITDISFRGRRSETVNMAPSLSDSFNRPAESEFTHIIVGLKGPHDADSIVIHLNKKGIPAGFCHGYPAVKDSESLTLAKIELEII